MGNAHRLRLRTTHGAARAGMFAAGAIRLPRWAGIRRRQLAEIAERTATMAE